MINNNVNNIRSMNNNVKKQTFREYTNYYDISNNNGIGNMFNNYFMNYNRNMYDYNNNMNYNEIMNNNKRIEYISLASVLSAIAVVYLHANSCFWQFSTARYWITANFIESTFYFAVPIFFMISGAMLIDYNKRYSLKEYFSKRITKTLIPFIIWSLIGLLIQVYYMHTIKISSIDLTYIINGLLNGSLVQVYWFFIPLFCIYLSIPVFAAIPDDKKKDILTYVCSLTFILNILIPFLISVFNLKINYTISIAVGGGSLFFALTGYLLHKYEISKKYRIILYILAIMGFLMHFLGTYYLSTSAGEVIKTYKGFTNIPSVLYSLGIFVFIKYDIIKLMKFNIIKKIVGFLDFYTFGIYLIHWYLLQFLIRTFNINNTSIIYRLFAPLIVLVLSVIIIYLIRKIPIIKKIVP